MPSLAELLSLAQGDPIAQQQEQGPLDALLGQSRAPDPITSGLEALVGRSQQPLPSQPGAPARGVQGLAQRLAAQRYGWTGDEWDALQSLWQRESGWNPQAVNQSSGAAGIPQMLPSAHPGIDVQQFLNDPREQILWGLRYLQGRYGSPSAALAHSDQHHWY